MKKLGTLIISAKLKKICNLKAKTNHATRWTSKYDILARYKEIRSVLSQVRDKDVDYFRTSIAQDLVLDYVIKKLKDPTL